MMSEFYAANPMSEVAHNLETHRESPDWYHAVRETADDPNITIDALTPAEQAKIRLHYIAAVHTEMNREVIGQAAGSVDYYLAETVTDQAFDAYVGTRRAFELSVAMWATGHNVVIIEDGTAQQDGELRHAVGTDHSYLQTVKKAYADGKSTPVYRTFDIDGSTPLTPGLDDRFNTVAEAAAFAHEIHPSNQRDDLYLKTNAELLDDLGQSISLLSMTGHEREAKQPNDISIIVANAVRRHPEKDELQFGIMIGETHLEAHSSLIHNSRIQTTTTRIPSHDGSVSMESELLHRATRSGEMPTNGELQKALLLTYLRKVIPTHPGNSQDTIRLKLEGYVSTIPETELTAMLNEIGTIKHTVKENNRNEYGFMDDEAYAIFFNSTKMFTGTKVFGRIKEYITGLASIQATVIK